MSQRLYIDEISVADYLAGELESEVRHEYLDGRVFAMSGTSDRHNRLAVDLAVRLSSEVEKGPCELFISDLKLYVEPNCFYYPDLMVACDPPGGDPYFRTKSVLLVEILSPGTERIDQREKRAAYTTIPTLVEYLIISQTKARVELNQRTGETWERTVYSQPDDEIALKSISFTLTIADIYRNIRF